MKLDKLAKLYVVCQPGWMSWGGGGERERERALWARHNKSEKNAGKPLYPLSRTCGFFFFIPLCRTYSQENITYLKNISNKWNTAVVFSWAVDLLRSTVLFDVSFENANICISLLNRGTTNIFIIRNWSTS